MAIPNFNLVDVIDGGAAENGQEVYFTLRLDDGKGNQDINVFWPYEKFGVLMAALSKFAAMTGEVRRKLNPSEGAVGTLDVAYSPPVTKFSSGPSTDGKSTILRAHLANRTQFDMAIDRKQLEKLKTIVEAALQQDQNGSQSASAKKKLN